MLGDMLKIIAHVQPGPPNDLFVRHMDSHTQYLLTTTCRHKTERMSYNNSRRAPTRTALALTFVFLSLLHLPPLPPYTAPF